MNDMDYAAFEAISPELAAASAELDRVFRERGIKDTDIPVIAKNDEEAMSAVRRMQAVQARLNAWLEANVS